MSTVAPPPIDGGEGRVVTEFDLCEGSNWPKRYLQNIGQMSREPQQCGCRLHAHRLRHEISKSCYGSALWGELKRYLSEPDLKRSFPLQATTNYALLYSHIAEACQYSNKAMV
eukprot:2992941-Amphidinium_carterae.1